MVVLKFNLKLSMMYSYIIRYINDNFRIQDIVVKNHLGIHVYKIRKINRKSHKGISDESSINKIFLFYTENKVHGIGTYELDY